MCNQRTQLSSPATATSDVKAVTLEDVNTGAGTDVCTFLTDDDDQYEILFV